MHETHQHYTGAITYQRKAKDRYMSARSATEYYIELAKDDDFTYFLHPGEGGGFVFRNRDLKRFDQDIEPVVAVSLRNTPIKGYRQAHHLRIRIGHANLDVATKWYCAYVRRCGGIVSERQRLRGGKTLWRTFIRAAVAETLKVSVVSIKTGKTLIAGVTVGRLATDRRALSDAALVLER